MALEQTIPSSKDTHAIGEYFTESFLLMGSNPIDLDDSPGVQQTPGRDVSALGHLAEYSEGRENDIFGNHFEDDAAQGDDFGGEGRQVLLVFRVNVEIGGIAVAQRLG